MKWGVRLTVLLGGTLSAVAVAGEPLPQPVGDAPLRSISRHTVQIPARFNVPLDSVCPDQAAALRAAFPQGLPLGVGSGLRWVRQAGHAQIFLGVTDRGPNAEVPDDFAYRQKVFPAPAYTPSLAWLRVDKHGARVTQLVPLKSADGVPHTGLPLPVGSLGSTNEHALDACLNPLPPSAKANGLDPEGVAVDAQGKVWIADEYGPFLVRFDPQTGRELDRAAPADGLPALLRYRQPNRGFEGLAVADGKVYAVLQSPLAQIPDPHHPDEAAARSQRATPRFIRLVEYDPLTRTSRTFAYPQDAAEQQPVQGADGVYANASDAKIGDLVGLGKGRFVLIEQGKGADKRLRTVLYRIDLRHATPIDALTVDGKPLEFVPDRATLRAAGVRFIAKTRLLDLQDYGWQQERTEGLALVGRDTLVLTNDNDFGLTSNARDFAVFPRHAPVDARRYRLTPSAPEEQQTALWLLRFKRPL